MDVDSIAGFFPRCVVTYVYPRVGEDASCDAPSSSGCSPIRTELHLDARTPATLHARGMWVPDFAASATVQLTLGSSVRGAYSTAAAEFGVERGSLKQMASGGSAGPVVEGGKAVASAPRADRGLSFHPWWCVCRQGLSAFDVGGWAIPLLDSFGELGLLGTVETSVTMFGAGLLGSGDGSEAWRVAFRH